MAQVHHVAQTGFGEGTNELYDRARPSYPSEVLTYLREQVPVASGLNVLELGSGTGIFTRALLAHESWSTTIGELRAVEPSAGMRGQFTKTVVAPEGVKVTCEDGTFDTTPVPDGWADVVFIAQAFHWCPDHEAACKEFARALKPHGFVALVWNLEDRDKAAWVAQLRDSYEKHEAGTPQFRLGLWRGVFDVPAYKSLFQPHVEKLWSRSIPATPESVVDRVFSKSYIAVLSPDDKAKVKNDVLEIVSRGDDKVWIDKDKGVFEYPYGTLVVIMKKAPQ